MPRSPVPIVNVDPAVVTDATVYRIARGSLTGEILRPAV